MRAVRRVVSAVVAVALLVLSLVVLVEVILAAMGRPPGLVDGGEVREELARRLWGDPMVILGWVSLMLLGAGLLIVSLAAGRQRSVVMDSGTEAASLSVRRRSLERYLAGIAAAQPGVQGARASVTRRRIKVRADTTRLDAQDVSARVRQAVGEQVRSLSLQPERALSVSLNSKED